MAKVMIFNHSMPQIGYIARTNTKGDEFDMVNQYIQYIIEKYNNFSKKKAAIFIEPQINTGYPDIVIVEYYDCLQNTWNEHRRKLTVNDFKILFEIQKQKNTSLQLLSEMLGFTLLDIQKSVIRLYDSNLIHFSKTKKSVRNVRLQNYCRISKIISIEAKIDKWSDAIRQATKNVWFSTESYILMNKDSCNSLITDKCKKYGIGIILVNGKIEKILDSERRNFPVSYTSLQFNEWIQREKNSLEENHEYPRA